MRIQSNSRRPSRAAAVPLPPLWKPCHDWTAGGGRGLRQSSGARRAGMVALGYGPYCFFDRCAQPHHCSGYLALGLLDLPARQPPHHWCRTLRTGTLTSRARAQSLPCRERGVVSSAAVAPALAPLPPELLKRKLPTSPSATSRHQRLRSGLPRPPRNDQCTVHSRARRPDGQNTIGMVRVCCSVAVAGVFVEKISSGCDPTSSFANRCIASMSAAAQRVSIRMLRPSVHPSFFDREKPRRSITSYLEFAGCDLAGAATRRTCE